MEPDCFSNSLSYDAQFGDVTSQPGQPDDGAGDVSDDFLDGPVYEDEDFAIEAAPVDDVDEAAIDGLSQADDLDSAADLCTALSTP